MRKSIVVLVTCATLPALARHAAPQSADAAAPPKPASLGLFVYPGAGQDAGRQGRDERECYNWARQQTGIDPTVAATPAPVADAPKGGAVKVAAKTVNGTLASTSKTVKVANAMIVPGSGLVKTQAEAEGLDKIFVAAGFEWREPG